MHHWSARRVLVFLSASRRAFLLWICLAAPWQQAAAADYLSPDLRARVEKLKADVEYLPTETLNIEQRARVLWEWANAYALNGGTLPVDVTQAVGAVFAYAETPRLGAALDDFIFEMTLLDSSPDALGTLTADTGPFEARSFVSIRQTYTVGSRPIQTGGGFLVARHFMPNYGIWQTRAPSADNYVSIRSSNPEVSFTVDSVPMSGMHGGFRGQQPALVFRLATGTLLPEDTVTITYGDTSQGSRGFLMADFESDRMPLPLYLAFNENEPFLTLPIQPVVVTGTDFAGLRGFAPSVVSPGEGFTLSVRGQDVYFNRSRNGHPPVIVRNGETELARLEASDDPISLLQLSLPEPGAYHLTLASPDGSIQGEVNPILVSADARERIYWGDTHGHSGFAEGIGTPEKFMTWARDDARLDFVTHSEHDIWMDDYEWEVLRRNVSRYTEEGAFIAYLGYEWSVRNLQGGHHNVLFRTPAGRSRIPVQFYPTLSRLYQGLRQTADTKDVVVIPHAHQAGDYRQSDPELEPLVEIASQHGNFEWFGRMYLNHGHQVGFIAASDNHLSQPGYSAPKNASLAQPGGLAAIHAPEKTTDALFDAMRALKAYATTGDRIILDVSVNGVGMGQRGPFAAERLLEGRVIGTAPIESITVFKNDQPLWSRDYLTDADRSPGGAEALLLSFSSASNPYHSGDNPRGWRHWRGTLTVRNGTLDSARGVDFHNAYFQSLERDPGNPNRLRFSTLTRGDTSSLEMVLAEARRSTSILIELEESQETGGAPPLYRAAQTVPGATLELELGELNGGRLERDVPATDYVDRVQLRRQLSEGQRDVRFDLRDNSTSQGDYYFVRVRQANDAMAWSSPIWIGGHPPR